MMGVCPAVIPYSPVTPGTITRSTAHGEMIFCCCGCMMGGNEGTNRKKNKQNKRKTNKEREREEDW